MRIVRHGWNSWFSRLFPAAILLRSSVFSRQDFLLPLHDFTYFYSVLSKLAPSIFVVCIVMLMFFCLVNCLLEAPFVCAVALTNIIRLHLLLLFYRTKIEPFYNELVIMLINDFLVTLLISFAFLTLFAPRSDAFHRCFFQQVWLWPKIIS